MLSRLPLEVGARTLLVDLGLRVVPLKTMLRILSRGRSRAGCRTMAETLRLARGFERRVYREPSCLRCALVVFWMADRGAVLHLGISRQYGELQAHAWVEWQGKHFSTDADPGPYEPLFAYEKK